MSAPNRAAAPRVAVKGIVDGLFGFLGLALSTQHAGVLQNIGSKPGFLGHFAQVFFGVLDLARRELGVRQHLPRPGVVGEFGDQFGRQFERLVGTVFGQPGPDQGDLGRPVYILALQHPLQECDSLVAPFDTGNNLQFQIVACRSGRIGILPQQRIGHLLGAVEPPVSRRLNR